MIEATRKNLPVRAMRAAAGALSYFVRSPDKAPLVRWMPCRFVAGANPVFRRATRVRPLPEEVKF
jgi:hypothetical protein